MTAPEPYYQADGVTIYNADCYEIAATLDYDLIVTDPPYGISLDTDFKRFQATSKNHASVVGDDEPFDPSPWLHVPAAMFGANHWAQRTPNGCTWHVWDKRDGIAPNMLADCEMWITTWMSGPTRVYRHKWLGYFREANRPGDGFDHPTAKPLALMRHIIEEPRTPAGVILDPFAGSGTTLVAARQCGRHAIGIELSEQYCDVAVRRLSQGVLF